MKAIDKSMLRHDFDAYTKAYLHDAYNEEDRRFIPNLESTSSYDCFSQKRYKRQPIPPGSLFNGWIDILMHEQETRCCYCMRRMETDEISVEHLVPESFDGLDEREEMAFYVDKAPYIGEHVILGREFDRMATDGEIDFEHMDRRPHLIAHANLFPACNKDKSGCSCNNHRGNKRILPLMLMPDVESFTGYDTDGNFKITHDDYEAARSTLINLDINSETLNKIRYLWYLFSRHGINPNAYPTTFIIRDQLIRKLLNLNEEDVIPIDFMEFVAPRNDYYWILMLKYDWFFEYYTQNFPIRPQPQTD